MKNITINKPFSYTKNLRISIEKRIGNKFKVTEYLRQHAKGKGKCTFDELCSLVKNNHQIKIYNSNLKYNIFVKNYFSSNIDKKLMDAVYEWNNYKINIENMVIKEASRYLGVKYKSWSYNQWNDKEPPFYSNAYKTEIDTVLRYGVNCAGLINLIIARLKIPLVSLQGFSKYKGGTLYWEKLLRRNRLLKKIVMNNKIPKACLLISKYEDCLNQGHLAITISEDILSDQKIIHSYCYNSRDLADFNNLHNPGVTIDKCSDFMNKNRVNFHYYAYPYQWLDIEGKNLNKIIKYVNAK